MTHTATKKPKAGWSTRQINIRVDPETQALLDAVKARDGVPYSQQVFRAVRMYAESKGISLSRQEGV